MNSISQNREMKPISCLRVLAKDLGPVLAQSAVTLESSTVGIILLCVHYMGKPFVRGFYCNDETIRYPHKESTVSSGLCYFGGSSINLILIALLEYLHLRRDGGNANGDTNERLANQPGYLRKLYIKNVYCRSIIWLFGGICSELLTDIFKFSAGRLRPHFIDVCKPIIRDNQGAEFTLDNYCQQNANLYRYLTNYYCSGDPSKLRDIRMSFLSGHSSYSAYSAAFAVFYIQAAMDGVKYGLIKPAIQVLIIATAVYVGLSRVSDYKHHWQDVFAGLSLGTLVAALIHGFIWPTFAKVYDRYFRAGRSQNGQGGEELGRVSY